MNAIIIRDIKESLLEESGSTMRYHAITLHFTKSETSITRSSFCRLSSEYLSGTSSSGVNLVLNHVLQSLVVGGTKEDHDFKFSTIKAIIHNLISMKLVTLLMKSS